MSVPKYRTFNKYCRLFILWASNPEDETLQVNIQALDAGNDIRLVSDKEYEVLFTMYYICKCMSWGKFDYAERVAVMLPEFANYDGTLVTDLVLEFKKIVFNSYIKALEAEETRGE